MVTVIRDGKAYETEVKTGTETADLIQILDGISAGDIVTISSGYGLPSGTRVTVSNGN